MKEVVQRKKVTEIQPTFKKNSANTSKKVIRQKIIKEKSWQKI